MTRSARWAFSKVFKVFKKWRDRWGEHFQRFSKVFKKWRDWRGEHFLNKSLLAKILVRWAQSAFSLSWTKLTLVRRPEISLILAKGAIFAKLHKIGAALFEIPQWVFSGIHWFSIGGRNGSNIIDILGKWAIFARLHKIGGENELDPELLCLYRSHHHNHHESSWKLPTTST